MWCIPGVVPAAGVPLAPAKGVPCLAAALRLRERVAF